MVLLKPFPGLYINSFSTNFGNVYGPYGGPGGGEFNLGSMCLVAFKGRAGKYIDAIGVWISN